jgi:hypothetical protein
MREPVTESLPDTSPITEKEREIERIIGTRHERQRNRKLVTQYLVQWADNHTVNWVNEDILQAPRLMEEYRLKGEHWHEPTTCKAGRLVMTLLIISALLVGAMGRSANGFLAYDCSHPQITKSFDSTHMTQCHQAEEMIKKTNEDTILLIQKLKVTYRTVRTCSLEYKDYIFYCGMHSHNSIIIDDKFASTSDVQHKECEEMFAQRTFKRHGFSEIISPEGTTVINTWMAGGVITEDGRCKDNVVFSREGRQYTGNWQRTFRVTLRSKEVAFDTETLKMVNEENSDCTTEVGECKIGATTVLITRTNIDTCHFVYTRELKVTRYSKPNNETSGNDLAYKIFISKQEEKMIYVETLDQTKECEVVMIRTTVSGLFITTAKNKAMLKPIKVADLDLQIQRDMKLMYNTNRLQQLIKQIHESEQQAICENKRLALENRIREITHKRNIDIINYHPLILAKVAGTILYYVKCETTRVNFEPREHCTEEIPITHNNISKCMQPHTRMIVDVCTKTECDPIFQNTFEATPGYWITYSTIIKESIKPQEFPLNITDNRLEWIKLKTYEDGGVYNAKDVERLRKQVQYGHQIRTIDKIISDHSYNEEGELYLSPEIISRIKAEARSWLDKIIGKLSSFGNFMAAIIGIYSIFSIISTVLRRFADYRTFGNIIKLPLKCLWLTSLGHHYVMKDLVHQNAQPQPPARLIRSASSDAIHELRELGASRVRRQSRG